MVLVRKLYLVCYDISDPKKLTRVHKQVQRYSVTGQKSFYECWLTKIELQSLIDCFFEELDDKTDRIHIFQLDPRLEMRCFGQAHRQTANFFMVV